METFLDILAQLIVVIFCVFGLVPAIGLMFSSHWDDQSYSGCYKRGLEVILSLTCVVAIIWAISYLSK